MQVCERKASHDAASSGSQRRLMPRRWRPARRATPTSACCACAFTTRPDLRRGAFTRETSYLVSVAGAVSAPLGKSCIHSQTVRSNTQHSSAFRHWREAHTATARIVLGIKGMGESRSPVLSPGPGYESPGARRCGKMCQRVGGWVKRETWLFRYKNVGF